MSKMQSQTVGFTTKVRRHKVTRSIFIFLLFWCSLISSCLSGKHHLANIPQLTFGGENAEAYFSFDGRQLIFQSTRDGRACDQEYVMGVDGSSPRLVSTGLGRVTCGYFFPAGDRILYSSTQATA